MSVAGGDDWTDILKLNVANGALKATAAGSSVFL